MKIKAFLLVVLFLGFSPVISAQSVTITPRKVTYKRPKPLTDYKKSFTVSYPKVRGVNPALARKIEASLSYEKNFDFTVNEEIREIQWLEDADFKVEYNKNGILDVTLWIEGSGAYPSGSSKPIVVDLRTGTRLRPQDVFINLRGLAAKAKKAQEAVVKQAIVDIKKENPEEENPARLFETTDFTVKDLSEFSVSDEGVTFWYDYGFPHVIQALAPEGRYFFKWSELKPFIKPGGAFAKFVR